MPHDHNPESDARLTDLLAGELSPEDAAALAEAMAADPELHAEQAELEAVYAGLQAAARATSAAAPKSLGPEGLAAILAAGAAAAEPEHGSAGSAVEAEHAEDAELEAGAAAGGGGGPGGGPLLLWVRRQRNTLQSIAAVFVVCGAVSVLYMGAQALQKQQDGPQSMAMESGATAPSADQAAGKSDDHLAGRSFAKADAPAAGSQESKEMASGLIGGKVAGLDAYEEAVSAPEPAPAASAAPAPMMAQKSQAPRPPSVVTAPAAKRVDAAKDVVALSKLKAEALDDAAPTVSRQQKEAATSFAMEAEAPAGLPAELKAKGERARDGLDAAVAMAESKPQAGPGIVPPPMPAAGPATDPDAKMRSANVLAGKPVPSELQALVDTTVEADIAMDGDAMRLADDATLPPGYPQRVSSVVFLDRRGGAVHAASSALVQVERRESRNAPETTRSMPSAVRAPAPVPAPRIASAANAAPADAAADAGGGAGEALAETTPAGTPSLAPLAQVLAGLRARGLAARIEADGVVFGDPQNPFVAMPYGGDAKLAERQVQAIRLARPAADAPDAAMAAEILVAVPAQSVRLADAMSPPATVLMAVYLPQPLAATVSLDARRASLDGVLRFLLAQGGLRHRVEGSSVVLHPLNRPLPTAAEPPNPDLDALLKAALVVDFRVNQQPLNKALASLLDTIVAAGIARPDLRLRLDLKAADGTPMVVLAPALQVPAAVAIAPDRWVAETAADRLVLRPREGHPDTAPAAAPAATAEPAADAFKPAAP